MSELVTGYLERALPMGTRIRVRWHLWLCNACRTYFAQMRGTVSLLARLPPQPPPPEVEREVLARLHDQGSSDQGSKQ